MQGFKEWHMVALFHCVISCAAGCGTQADTAATTMYDSAHERYGTSDESSADVSEADANSETGDNPRINSASDPATEMVSNATAASTSPGEISSAGGNADSTATHGEGPPTASDVLPANSGELLSTRVSQLENQIAQLQDELQHRQIDHEVLQATSPEPVANAVSVDRLRESVVDASQDASATESRRSEQPSAMSRYARMDLDRLITRYKRARTAMARSEASYKIDHVMTIAKLIELSWHGAPLTFGSLPGRDEYAFKDFREAADALVPELEYYLDDLASADERSELEPLLSEARQVTKMEPPGTGNRMMDFMQQAEKLDQRYQDEQQH